MLLLDDVFAQTWGARAGSPLARPFWVEVIGELHASVPDFWFVAEAYWGREPDLLAQGFDACYDKAAYDHLVARDPGALRVSIRVDQAAQQRTLRFTENHDEHRAAATFGPGAVRLAALVVALLPGGLLVHEGQLDGRRVQLPVALGRRPLEAADPDLRRFHHEVLRLRRLVDRDRAGFHACDITGWLGNPSTGSLLAWEWTQADRRQLVVVNLGPGYAQGSVHLAPPPEVSILLADRLAGRVYRRRAEDVAEGLYVELPPWGAHVFEVVGEPDA
jgi:hypothetical protein